MSVWLLAGLALSWQRDAIAVLVGSIVYALFAVYAHAWLFGVRPFG